MNLKSIATTFLALMITLLILISLGLLITSNKFLEKKLTAAYISNSSEQMALVTQSINKFYQRIEEDLHLFAVHPLLTSDTDDSSNHMLNQSIYYLLAQYATNHSGIQSIYFLTPDGMRVQWPISHMDSSYDTQLKTLISYFQSTGHNIFKSSPALDIENNAVISHIAPVYDTHGAIQGIIGIDVSQSYIGKLLSTKTTISDTAFFMLFDDTGMILADSSSSENSLKSLSDLNIFKLDTLDLLSKDTLTSLELSINNAIYITSIVQVPYTNWFIMSLILKSEMLGPISKITPVFVAASTLLLVIASSLMIFATKRILNQKTIHTAQPLHYAHQLTDSIPGYELDPDLEDIADFFKKISSSSNASKDSISHTKKW